MNPIRPTGYQPPPPANPAADAARLAAQRAFFDQALGRAAPAAQPPATARPQAVAAIQPAPTASVQAPPAAAPTQAPESAAKLPRPGSIIDIRV